MAKRAATKAVPGGAKRRAGDKAKGVATKRVANGTKRSGRAAKAAGEAGRNGKGTKTGRGNSPAVAAEAKRLFEGYIKAGMRKRSGGWELYMWPKELAATPAAKGLTAAPAEIQIEVVRLAAADLARGRESALPTPVLLNTLLRRALPLPPEVLRALLRAAARKEFFQVSPPVLVTFLERWFKAHEPDGEVVRAATAYRDGLDPEHRRKERQRLSKQLDSAAPTPVSRAASAAPDPSISGAALDRLVDELVRALPTNAYSVAEIAAVQKVKELGKLAPADIAAVVGRLGAKIAEARKRRQKSEASGDVENASWTSERANAMELVVQRLLVRKLPLSPGALAALCRSAYWGGSLWLYGPLGGIVRAIELAAEEGRLTGEAAAEAERLHAALSLEHGAEAGRLAERARRAIAAAAGGDGAAEGVSASDAAARSVLERALLDRESLEVGDAPWLFDAAMEAMVLPPEGEEGGVVSFAADRLGVDAPILDAIAARLRDVPARYSSDGAQLGGPLVRALRDHSPARAAAAAAACAAAMSHRPIRYEYDGARAQRFHNGVIALIRAIPKLLQAAAKHRSPAAADDLAEAFHALSRLKEPEYITCEWGDVARGAAAAAAPILARGGEPPARLLVALLRLRERVARCAYERGAVREFDTILGIAPDLCVELGERWSDRMYMDLRSMPAQKRAAWGALLLHCSMASGGQPSGKWLKRAAELREQVGPAAEVESALAAWFSLVGKPRPAWPGGKVEGRDSSVPSDRAADALKGLAWSAAVFDTPRMAQALGDLAMACYKMVPGVGARCIKPGTSAVWALSQMTIPEALGQLSRIRQLVKFGTAKKVLDASLERLAKQLNMTTDELHEVAVPDFGLERGGALREEAGDFTIELAIKGSSAEVRILAEDGEPRKSVPEAVKKGHKATLAAVKQAAADIDKMLAAQKDRLERLYHDQRTWPATLWRARYLDHPLVGALAGRLIWSATRAGRTREMIPLGGRFVDARGKEVELRDDDTVSLWHPILADPSRVLAWRGFLEEREIRQPFKQAHREIYPLTDAERRTRTYSNRFAAHIVKQGQLHALCQQRGWKHALYVMDSGEPPMLHLPKWNLYVHYLVQPIGDDTYGTVGAYAYLETDQVAFSRTRVGEKVPLEEVPPLALSEVMRDVDLFVAVASVGNNPEWEDGGPDGRFGRYWWEFGFGDLAESGKSRRDTLARLLPRLRIGAACTLEERFLRVRGSLREYKIHLGSGNILMEPDDKYLCIVPGGRDEHESGKVFLPFEGDRVLAIILSKAFMLAEDDKIKDLSIVSQIRRR